jgi:hypothetical protein
MTLAVILVSILLASLRPLPAASLSQDAPQAAPSNSPDQGSKSAAQDSSASKPTSPTTGTGQVPAMQNHPPAKRAVRKKKAVPPNCNPDPATARDAAAAGSAPSSSAPQNGPAGGTPPSASARAPSNCPPAKIIVRQGGTSEPSIQLVGGPSGEQATQQRNNANQMLAAADENLKKIAGRELTASQQDMVNQVHQFMEQSKAATTTGDLDRARTLAWKAQLLSEELVNPQK